MSATLDSKLEALYRIADGHAEVLQFEVLKGSAIVATPLKKLRLKKNILIAYIIRGDELIYPGGDDMIFPGDHVIAVTFEHDFDEVDDLLIDEARK
jgi:trk system potassium uptake protein TrkA